MTTITLVFQHDDGQETVECVRMRVPAGEVREQDYVDCPLEGYVHVHTVTTEDRCVYLGDCDDHEHVYSVNTLLDIARPVEELHG